jgi:hypothetical protein
LWRLQQEEVIARVRLLLALAALESWLVRRMVMADTAKNYNNVVVSLLGRMGTADKPVDDPVGSFIDYLRDGDDKTRWWPSDETMRERLTDKALYGSLTRERERFLLEVIEARLRTSKTEAVTFDEKLTIEHVIPQTWDEQWPLPDVADDELAVALRKNRIEHIHRLGNLSLVTGSLNPGMGNDPWAEKRAELAKFSALRLNADLVHDYPETFDEASIDERGAKLAEKLIEEWPGPASPLWG